MIRQVGVGDSHPIRILVKAFDRRQRWRLGIREFTTDEKCIIRIGEARAMRDTVLSDGTTVYRGDRIGVLHFSNERMPVMPENGPDLAWALSYNPDLTVLVACGYYDYATPFFDAEYTMVRHGIDMNRVTMTYYEAGHMMYLHDPSREAVAGDIRDFILGG